MLLASAIAVWVALSLLWAVSVRRRDTSIIDAFWGPGFGLIAVVALAKAPEISAHGLLIAAMILLWSLRLGAHLLRRNLAHGEDRRYREMREAAPGNWAVRSYVTVFMLQGVLMWLISLPVQFAIGGNGLLTHPLTIAGTTLFLFGFVFEAVADAQLWRFKQDPASKGRVMETGLWRYSRHPNYFGETCVWWGLFLACLPAHGAWWTLFSPLLVTFLLLKVSGLPLAEKKMSERRPGYDAYIARTSAFIPLPPKR